MPPKRVSVLDLAIYLMVAYKGSHAEPMTHMKLQRLVYYCQAWYLAWKGEDCPIFTTRIEAWIHGPVSPHLFDVLEGRYEVEPKHVDGNPENLDPDHRQIAKMVLDYYGDKSSERIGGIIQSERPWNQAREGIDPSKRGSQVISHASMEKYYYALSENGFAV